jgi:hypothetical protein
LRNVAYKKEKVIQVINHMFKEKENLKNETETVK